MKNAMILCLLGVNVFALYQYNLLAEKPPGNDLPYENLELLTGVEEPEQGKPLLLIFFNADELCRCLDDWANWNTVVEKFGDRVQVKGVFNGSDLEKFLVFHAEQKLTFPVYRDPNRLLQRRLLIPPGIISKALVSPNGHLIYLDIYQEGERDQRYFIQRLVRHLDHFFS